MVRARTPREAVQYSCEAQCRINHTVDRAPFGVAGQQPTAAEQGRRTQQTRAGRTASHGGPVSGRRTGRGPTWGASVPDGAHICMDQCTVKAVGANRADALALRRVWGTVEKT
ncbi:hypothetical protein GCM10023238_00420 [Streptomyces heliomycini]